MAPRTVALLGNAADRTLQALYRALGDQGIDATLTPLPTHSYDLVICLGISRWIEEADAVQLVAELCRLGDDILFAPLDLIAPAGNFASAAFARWAGLFLQHEFVYDAEFDPSFLVPGSVRLRRSSAPSAQILAAYSAQLWRHNQTRQAQRRLTADQSHLYAQLAAQANAVTQQLRHYRAKAERLERQFDALADQWNALHNSPGYAVLKQLQLARARLAPPHSRRERLLETFLGWIRIAGRRGIGGLWQHFRGELRWRTQAVSRQVDNRHRRGHSVEIRPEPPRPVVRAHQASVDIVVCVHNALDDVRRCLTSVVQKTGQPYRLILVDDGSDAPTRDFLADFARKQNAEHLRSNAATGYTLAANRGLRHSDADFVVLLNSDTIVTPSWLDRLIACADSQQRIGLVGPLSNTASWQSVPEVSLGDDWADNPLPLGMDVDDWGELIARRSARHYPPMPLLNGFCLMIRRAVLDEIGLFDEEHFGAGYGEENDYCLRAREAGWRLALADDVFIYHAQSRSYSHERRKQLSNRAADILARQHDPSIIADSVQYCRENPVLEGIRSRVALLPEREEWLERGRKRFGGHRLLFVLPIDGPGGGGNVIVCEGEAMRRMGVEVEIFNLHEYRSGFENAYPGLEIPTHYGSRNDVALLAQEYDAVIATWHESVEWLADVQRRGRYPIRGYYVQDYEPHFYPAESEDHRRAKASYRAFPDLRCFTKTEWNRQEVAGQVGVDCALVGTTVDVDCFRPRVRGDELRRTSRPLQVVAMVRPNSARRSPRLTMQMLRRLSHRFGAAVEITIFGTSFDDPGLAELPQDFDWRLAGVLDQRQMAWLLNQADIFADLSTYQAMGLTALEAMASGTAVIVPEQGGSRSFAAHEQNALVVDTHVETACWEALVRLVEEEGLRRHLQHQALRDTCRYYPERAAFTILDVLFAADSEKER